MTAHALSVRTAVEMRRLVFCAYFPCFQLARRQRSSSKGTHRLIGICITVGDGTILAWLWGFES
jgi:hypothetical protein